MTVTVSSAAGLLASSAKSPVHIVHIFAYWKIIYINCIFDIFFCVFFILDACILFLHIEHIVLHIMHI